jgi:flavin reductase (DIM6/NTAB) family NADH-FMN oxidoreductase RutF
MKNLKAIAATVLLLLGGINMNAQTENGFKEIDVRSDFTDNAFSFFADAPILAAADSTGNGYNAMTIGWGEVGTLWGHDRPAMTVYVAQKRYTHEFMERAKYFTVMTFDNPDVPIYMGHHSGRDGDKAKALGLHVAYTKHGAPYFTEASAVYECEIMYGQQLDKNAFRNDVPRKLYNNFPAGIHSMYIGEIVGAWQK